ncbi:60S acidic ribosomal protein [Naegleria gruberi]|uniref:Ribosome assembly factor mrt4 n=1 Tax=Naegleria gruberi TaxID=5762 RepID=D2V7G4_NAEGR|nr:60S acidic ribosomal protein [Naegleria gruberi]EFC47373.1 60S acidic ribosomal protein [Naegleria gruberi]|eukprot:XP_002680117.1 60S acidic ribosomal protein [Naegleria gruberi strain NEG-M]
MPKAKRDKLITLTKTKKRSTKEQKNKLVEEIRNAIEEFNNIYILDLSNCRTNHVKEIRRDFNESKFFMTKNKVMRVALGTSPENEVENDLHNASKFLTATRALFITDRPKAEVAKYFANFKRSDYAKVGFVATKTITLEAGPVDWMPFSLEERLLNLGLPIEVKNKVINILRPFNLCTFGEPITAQQAKLLKHFGHELTEFNASIVCHYDKKTHKLEKFVEEPTGDEEEGDDDEMEY